MRKFIEDNFDFINQRVEFIAAISLDALMKEGYDWVTPEAGCSPGEIPFNTYVDAVYFFVENNNIGMAKWLGSLSSSKYDSFFRYVEGCIQLMMMFD